MPSGLSVSTHVLDGAGGGPRRGVPVTVTDGAGHPVADGVTDEQGRITELASGLAPGTYAVTWRTGGRVTAAVTVTFHLGEDRHYHLPLLAADAMAVSYLGG
jgi:5-hydroxyisourate hydrolase